LLEASSVSVPSDTGATQIRSLVERGVLDAKDIEGIEADEEHFDHAFAVALREEWGRVRKPSVVTVPSLLRVESSPGFVPRTISSVVKMPAEAAANHLELTREMNEEQKAEFQASLFRPARGTFDEDDDSEDLSTRDLVVLLFDRF